MPNTSQHWLKESKQPAADNSRRSWTITFVALGVVVAILAAFGIYAISKSNSSSNTVTPPAPTTTPSPKPDSPNAPQNLTLFVTGTEKLPTVAVRWQPPKSNPSKVSYVVRYANARLSTNASAGKPFQSPCLTINKPTNDTKVVLPAPFDQGVLYVDVVAKIPGAKAERSAPVLLVGPLSKKQGQAFTPTHTALGSTPASEWCHSQNLTE